MIISCSRNNRGLVREEEAKLLVSFRSALKGTARSEPRLPTFRIVGFSAATHGLA